MAEQEHTAPAGWPAPGPGYGPGYGPWYGNSPSEPGILVPRPDPTVLTTAQLYQAIAALREILEAQLTGQRGEWEARAAGLFENVRQLHMDVRQHPDAIQQAIQTCQRETSALRELIEARLSGIREATQLLQTITDRVPQQVDAKVDQLGTVLEQRFETMDERFNGIQRQFVERDTRTEQLARAGETALTAALNAAKEAVSQQSIAFGQATSKAEAGFIKQLDQLVALFQTGMRALDEKISTATKTSDDKIVNVEKQVTLLLGTGAGALTATTARRSENSGNVALIGMIIGGAVGVTGLILAFTR